MELLQDKLLILKKIVIMTNELSDAASMGNYDELNNILEERQLLMNQIDSIDLKIKDMKIDEHEHNIIKNEISAELKKIIDIDNKTKLLISKKENELRKKIQDVDLKIKIGNYDIDDEEKKPKGYFLNTKN